MDSSIKRRLSYDSHTTHTSKMMAFEVFDYLNVLVITVYMYVPYI